MWYVYILNCSDNEIYTGCTNDLKDRIYRHTKGYVLATKERRPLSLENYFAFQDKYKAFDFWFWPSIYQKAFIKIALINIKL